MKNNKIAGVGSYRIQYVSARCSQCGVNTEEGYTFKGRCADCRADEYGVMPHQAMEYEFKNGLRESVEAEDQTKGETTKELESVQPSADEAHKTSISNNNVIEMKKYKAKDELEFTAEQNENSVKYYLERVEKRLKEVSEAINSGEYHSANMSSLLSGFIAQDLTSLTAEVAKHQALLSALRMIEKQESK